MFCRSPVGYFPITTFLQSTIHFTGQYLSPWCVCFLCQSYIFHGDSALSLDWFLTLVWRQMMNGAIKVCVLLRWGAGYNSDFISPERSAADEAVTWHIQHGFCSVLRCWMRKWQIQWSSSPERGSTHSRFGACGSFYSGYSAAGYSAAPTPQQHMHQWRQHVLLSAKTGES